jgi:hypothetical protein
MNSGEKFNQFAQQNGGSVLHQDENLILQKELKEELVFWGSVYGSDFVEMPDTAFTSEAAYRTWCWKTTGMMPEKKGNAFDKYIRTKMLEATVRPTLPGTEYGAEVEDAMERLLELGRNAERANIDLDEAGAGRWSRGMSYWIETLPDSGNGQELIIRVKPFMRQLNYMESRGSTQGHILRREVCKRLAHYGRQISGRDGSVERYRCAYALPLAVLYEGFDAVK